MIGSSGLFLVAVDICSVVTGLYQYSWTSQQVVRSRSRICYGLSLGSYGKSQGFFCVFGLRLHFDRVRQLCMDTCAARALGRDEGRSQLAGHLTQTTSRPWAPCLSSPSCSVLSSPTALGRGGLWEVLWEVLLVLHRSFFVITNGASHQGRMGNCPAGSVLCSSCAPLPGGDRHLLWNPRAGGYPGVPRVLAVTSPRFLLCITAFGKAVWNALLKGQWH